MPTHFLTPEIKSYIQNMKPGDVIEIWKVKRPLQLIWAGKEYIDQGNNDIEFSHDLERLKKL